MKYIAHQVKCISLFFGHYHLMKYFIKGNNTCLTY